MAAELSRTLELPPTPYLLVVDDDPDIREPLLELLTGEGYEVVGAKNGLEALEHIRATWNPALILLDLNMPVMDGRTMLAELQAAPALRAIPVVLATASGISLTAADGVTATLFKPLDIEQLLATIRDHARLVNAA